MQNQEEVHLEILRLKAEVVQLKREVEFLRQHSSLAQGLRGESLVTTLLSGEATTLNDSFDVTTQAGTKLEVKFSKLHRPSKQADTRRWVWGKPLGWLDKGKHYDYLILVGEKDPRYPSQYSDDSPYCTFCIPLSAVRGLMNEGRTIGGVICLTTNFAKLRAQKGLELLKLQVSQSALQERFWSQGVADTAAIGTSPRDDCEVLTPLEA